MKNIENSASKIRGTTWKVALLAMALAFTTTPAVRAGEDVAPTGPSSDVTSSSATTTTAASDDAAGQSTQPAANRLRHPDPIDAANPHAAILTKTYARAVAAYRRLWNDYYRPRWDLYRYIVNLITYTRIYHTYHATLRQYWKWEDENQRSFTGRIVFYPAGTMPPSPDPLAVAGTPSAPSTGSFPSTSNVTDTGKGSGTASGDDWTKGTKESVDKIGPTSTPFTGSETVVTSTAASATATPSASLTLDPSQPVAGAKIEISLNINYIRDPGPDGYPRHESTSDASGNFLFPGLQQGVWTYNVSAPGFATATGTFEVQEGKLTRNIVLEKESSHEVTGNVYTVQASFLSERLRNLINESDAIDGSLMRQIESHLSGGNGRSFPLYLRPVRQQEVTLTRTDPVIAIFPAPPAEVHATDTDSSGAFGFSGLKGQMYRLDVDRDGYKPYSLEVDTTQKTESLRIILIEEDGDLGDTPLITE